jgi:ATP-binding cassette, subfamily B, bacterial
VTAAEPGVPRPGRARAFLGALVFQVRLAPVPVLLRVVGVVAVGIAPVAAAALLARLVDALTSEPDRSTVLLLAVAIAVVTSATALLQHACHFLDTEIGRRVGLRLHSELFGAVSRESGLSTLEDPVFHNRLQLARNAVETVPQMFTPMLLSVIQSLITLAGFVVALLVISPLAAGLALVSIVPAGLVQRRLSRLRAAAFVEQTSHQRRISFYALLLSDLRVAKEVRLFDLGDHLRDRLVGEVGQVQGSERRVDARTALLDSLVALLSAAVLGGVLVVAVLDALAGRSSAGQVTLLVAALGGVQASVAAVIGQVGWLDQGSMLLEHYRAIVEDAPAPRGRDDAKPAGPVGPLRESVVFHDVWFRYGPSHDWVLRGVDLELRRGETTAVVGVNGAGKSTIAKLLCRLYEPERGRITWDGVDIADLDVTELRARISAVFQDFVCWELSAHDNVALGSLADAARPGAVEQAARHAGMHDAISALPGGYDTMLTRAFEGDPVGGEQVAGVVLSGGQWQRLAAARAFVRSATDVLVLDEPSSGLDPQAEADLLATLVDAAPATCLVISHRVRAVRGADAIVVLDEGVVAERGSHDELTAAGGAYARWVRVQADAFVGELPEAVSS